jgi:polar amino acid transport system substrate-binding protein
VRRRKMSKRRLIGSVLLVTLFLLGACTTPTPETVVERVVETVEVEREVEVVRTVEVEKEVQVVVTATPEEVDCVPLVEPPLILYPGKIIMSVNPTVPPLQYVEEDGSLAGMRVELGREIARRLCLEPEYVNIQFEAMIPGLTGGRFDMINTGIWYKEDRAEIMEMVPYELTGLSVAVPMDNPDNVESIEDLAGLTVAVEASGITEMTMMEFNEEFAAKDLEQMDIRAFKDSALSFSALAAGQADAAVGNDARVIMHQMEGEFKQALRGLNAAPACLAFANTELAGVVAEVLQDMYEDGYYDELFDTYGIRKIMDWDQWDGVFEVY